MARYPLTFVNYDWSYDGNSGYKNLARFKNTNSYSVKITKIELYLGTGNGRFHPSPESGGGDDVYGQGNPIYNWLKIYDTDGRNSHLATSPNNEDTGQIITKQVASEYEGWGNYYIPVLSGCGLYSYTTFTLDWVHNISPEIPAGHTVLITTSGGGESLSGRGILCVNNAQGYITVEPVNPNVTLTLKYNYSGAPNQGTYKTLSVPINNTTQLSSPQREGYMFMGWFTASSGGSRVSNPYKVTANTTLYAHWDVLKYSIEYFTQDDSIPPEWVSFASQTNIAYGSQPTLIANIPSRGEGYSFSSWNTKDDGTGTSYVPGSKIVMPANNLLLYAQWITLPPIWVYSTTDNQWHNAADSSDPPNYHPIYRYNTSNSRWENNQNINIYNKPNDETPGTWKEVTSNGGQ